MQVFISLQMHEDVSWHLLQLAHSSLTMEWAYFVLHGNYSHIGKNELSRLTNGKKNCNEKINRILPQVYITPDSRNSKDLQTDYEMNLKRSHFTTCRFQIDAWLSDKKMNN